MAESACCVADLASSYWPTNAVSNSDNDRNNAASYYQTFYLAVSPFSPLDPLVFRRNTHLGYLGCIHMLQWKVLAATNHKFLSFATFLLCEKVQGKAKFSVHGVGHQMPHLSFWLFTPAKTWSSPEAPGKREQKNFLRDGESNPGLPRTAGMGLE